MLWATTGVAQEPPHAAGSAEAVSFVELPNLTSPLSLYRHHLEAQVTAPEYEELADITRRWRRQRRIANIAVLTTVGMTALAVATVDDQSDCGSDDCIPPTGGVVQMAVLMAGLPFIGAATTWRLWPRLGFRQAYREVGARPERDVVFSPNLSITPGPDGLQTYATVAIRF